MEVNSNNQWKILELIGYLVAGVSSVPHPGVIVTKVEPLEG